ncbi:MAG: EamA family transporter [Candidatus Eremiobacteraeota bacterium]|nr:EamA family transporter [Candidatus Eremiobacteraeota bacterium]
MTPAALGLLLVAACLHAGWNFRLKRCQERLIVLWWALAFSALAVLPVLAWVPLPQGRAWMFVLASAAAQAVYLGLLSLAYSLADFSLVYPVARGSAPLFLLIWSTRLLHEPLHSQGLLGVGVLSLGLMGMGMSGILGSGTGMRLGGRMSAQLGALLAAFGVAFTISIYTALDGYAVKGTPALSYFVAQWCLSVLLALPPLLLRNRWGKLLDVLRRERGAVVWVGTGSALAYFLALQAYQWAPVGYAGAVREVSVVLGAFLGWRFGGEPGGPTRLFSAVVIFCGILLVATSR